MAKLDADDSSIASSASTMRIRELEKELQELRLKAKDVAVLEVAVPSAPKPTLAKDSGAWLSMLTCASEARMEALDSQAWKKKKRVRFDSKVEAWKPKARESYKPGKGSGCSRAKRVLFDTGAQVSACTKDFARAGTKFEGSNIRIWGVGDHEVQNYGTYQVPYALKDGKVQCLGNWECSEINKDVLTAGGLINKGKHAAWLDDYGSYLVHKEAGVKVRWSWRSISSGLTL